MKFIKGKVSAGFLNATLTSWVAGLASGMAYPATSTATSSGPPPFDPGATYDFGTSASVGSDIFDGGTSSSVGSDIFDGGNSAT